MKLAFNATIVVEMQDPLEFGYAEPTVKSTVDLLRSGRFEVSTPELFMDPVIFITQKQGAEK